MMTETRTTTELDVLCAEIAEQALLMRSAMEQRKRIRNACGAFVRRLIGWSAADDEAERKRMRAAAQAAIAAIEKGEEPEILSPACLVLAQEYVNCVLASCEPWEVKEKVHRKQLGKLSKRLPVWMWAEGVKGLGEVMLGQIIAETGNLDNYPNPAKVWKRLGQAPRDCYKMIKKDGTEGITEPKQRKAVVWNAAECLIKAAGPYYQLYLERKAYEEERYADETVMDNGRKMTKGWRAARAERVMVKRMLCDLWAAWRKEDSRLPAGRQAESAEKRIGV